jgi:hypothetical protein
LDAPTVTSALGSITLVAVSAFLSVRYLLAALRTRRLAEGALAAVLFLSGVVGIGANAAYQAGLRATAAGPATLAVTLLAGNLGASIATAFCWRVFRPASELARGAAALLSVLLLASMGAHLVGDGFQVGAGSVPLLLTGVALRAAAFGWTSIECLASYFRLRKQLRFGLADPVTCNRFLLFGVATGAVVLASAAGAASVWSGLCRLTTGAAILLACAPPRVYLDYVARSAPARA